MAVALIHRRHHERCAFNPTRSDLTHHESSTYTMSQVLQALFVGHGSTGPFLRARASHGTRPAIKISFAAAALRLGHCSSRTVRTYLYMMFMCTWVHRQAGAASTHTRARARAGMPHHHTTSPHTPAQSLQSTRPALGSKSP